MTARDAATETDPTDEIGSAGDTATADSGAAVDLAKPAPAVGAEAAEAEAAEGSGAADEPADGPTGDAVAAEKPTTRHRRRERSGPRRRWPLVALLTVAVLFAGAMAALFLTTRPADIAGLRGPQQSAVDAATQAAVNLQTFRRASFDQDFANAIASLTPQFAQEQLAPRKDALKQQLDAGGRDATATALSAGLVSSTSTQAVVLVVTNTTQTSDTGASTPFVFSRLQLSMQRVGGKWLVSDLKSVGLS